MPCFDAPSICFSTLWCIYNADLILCDYCTKAFHLECHIPRLDQIPKGTWRCCECSATLYKKRQHCGECKDCLRPDCGKCTACQRKKKFGGDSKHLKPCKERNCRNMRFVPPETMSNEGTRSMKSKEKEIKLKSNRRTDFKSVVNSSNSVVSRNSLNLDCPFKSSFKPTINNGFNCTKYKIVRMSNTNNI